MKRFPIWKWLGYPASLIAGVVLALVLPPFLEPADQTPYRKRMVAAAKVLFEHPPMSECNNIDAIKFNALPGQVVIHDLGHDYAYGEKTRDFAPITGIVTVRRDHEIVLGIRFTDGCISPALPLTLEKLAPLAGLVEEP